MIADGQIVGDGTWELKVLVTDLAVERCFRVKGDLHIGGVMLRLVEDLGMKFLIFFQLVNLMTSLNIVKLELTSILCCVCHRRPFFLQFYK